MLGMQHQQISHTQLCAHVGVVGFPGKLNVSAAVIGIGVGSAIGISDFDRHAIGPAFALAEFFQRLPLVGALTLHGGKHIGSPSHIRHVRIFRDVFQDGLHPGNGAGLEGFILLFVLRTDGIDIEIEHG